MKIFEKLHMEVILGSWFLQDLYNTLKPKGQHPSTIEVKRLGFSRQVYLGHGAS